MVAMEPGRDRKEWWLCGPCWIEGRTPMKLGRVKVTEIADPKLYDALVSASKRTPGIIEVPPDAAPAAKKPRARRSR